MENVCVCMYVYVAYLRMRVECECGGACEEAIAGREKTPTEQNANSPSPCPKKQWMGGTMDLFGEMKWRRGDIAEQATGDAQG